MKISLTVRNLILGVLFISLCHVPLSINGANKDVLYTNKNSVSVYLDGKELKGGWRVVYGDKIDPLDAYAHEVVFISDCDTLAMVLDEWQVKDFKIINENGEQSPVRVTRIADNIYENPDPRLLKKAPNGLLTRQQAEFDIRAMVYGISEVHPDMFSVCKQVDFFSAINKAIASLPDSVSVQELYKRVAPIVAMIGDGHTNVFFPFNDVFTKETKVLPVSVDVLNNKSIICRNSLDTIIPNGAVILSINGVPAEMIVDSMLPFVAGEKEHFKISRINSSFYGLYHMLYPADSFEIVYRMPDSGKTSRITYEATAFEEIIKQSPKKQTDALNEPYSFTIDKDKNVAVMDFRSFQDIPKMELFADSMFRELHSQNISNLIIDIRNNGGGNSSVGDVLLRYISPEPFVQMDKALTRITPFTKKLMGMKDGMPYFSISEVSPSSYIEPRTEDEGYYNGNVYLLISNKTFSSAGSFAWVFKECGMGKVLGEETGGMNVCFGDVLGYKLPVSGLQCSISYKRFWQFRADENDIHGTIPDVEVPASDALVKALEIIGQ